MTAGGTAEVGPDHLATIRSPLPDEVQFESLVTRVRTFTLKSDRLYWPKILDALDRLTGLEDQRPLMVGATAPGVDEGHQAQHAP